jgi:hypothetical protein
MARMPGSVGGSLYAFAGCAVLGILPPFAITGKARNWP